jgi:hypothetical protein
MEERRGEPKVNKYPGKCGQCGQWVREGEGFLGEKVQGRWTVVCSTCSDERNG